MFLDGESMSLWEVRLQIRQWLSGLYPADAEESSLAAPEEVASIGVLTG